MTDKTTDNAIAVRGLLDEMFGSDFDMIIDDYGGDEAAPGPGGRIVALARLLKKEVNDARQPSDRRPYVARCRRPKWLACMVLGWSRWRSGFM